jgi:ribosomal protein S18 acetylase RimI-like enzyme
LRRFCEPGDRFYCGEWDGPAPAGWTIEMDTRMCAMLWAAATPRAFASDDVVRLDSAHVPQMLALAGATKPGPYAQRPLEIGEWYGILDNDQVVAMAGERAHAGELREVSGVCTMPGYQGRGYAKRLTEHVIRSQLARGFTPFLHVASANLRARALYERMGFVVDQEIPLRIVELRE